MDQTSRGDDVLSELHVQRLTDAAQLPERKLGNRWRCTRVALLNTCTGARSETVAQLRRDYLLLDFRGGTDPASP